MHLVVSSYGESFALIGSVSLGADVETSPSVPRRMLMPIILLFAIVGSYAINNSLFDVGLMLAFGVLAFVLEENDFPVAPVILGVVLGPLLEEYFINSMIKSDGRLIGLVDRPIAAVLAAITIAIVGWTIVASLRSAKANEQHTAGRKRSWAWAKAAMGKCADPVHRETAGSDISVGAAWCLVDRRTDGHAVVHCMRGRIHSTDEGY